MNRILPTAVEPSNSRADTPLGKTSVLDLPATARAAWKDYLRETDPTARAMAWKLYLAALLGPAT